MILDHDTCVRLSRTEVWTPAERHALLTATETLRDILHLTVAERAAEGLVDLDRCQPGPHDEVSCEVLYQAWRTTRDALDDRLDALAKEPVHDPR